MALLFFYSRQRDLRYVLYESVYCNAKTRQIALFRMPKNQLVLYDIAKISNINICIFYKSIAYQLNVNSNSQI